jgi:sterol 3beta-glucosyltransferase
MKDTIMHIQISTFGTQGDIQPFIAFGNGLRAAGHTVTICTSAAYRAVVEAHGLGYTFMDDALLDLSRALLDGQGNTLAVMRQMGPAMQRTIDDEWCAAQTIQPDAIVYHPKMLGSYHIAEKLGIPLVMAIPLPCYTPTQAFPHPFFATLRLGGRFNRLSHQLVGLSSAMFTGMTNRFRTRTLGLPPQRRFADLLVRANGTPVPILYPYSPALLPVPADFPSHVHVTGTWFLERPAMWRPDAVLEQFLASGPPPVYVGFGSMSGKQAAGRAQIVLDALAQTGQRGLLASGWGGLEVTQLPANVQLIDAAPHDWLFPRMAAVVHHGGAGTTAAGLRAGRPTVICPFLGDQPFWGTLVHARGVGPQPIPQRQLSVPRLTTAINAAVNDPLMRQRAAVLSALMQAEDGVARAIAIIEQVVRRSDGGRQSANVPARGATAR